MSGKDITDIRGTMEFLKREGELITVKEQVDPIYEIAAIQVALDDGPALLFENIKGYPGIRSIGNVLARRDTLAKIFDAADYKQDGCPEGGAGLIAYPCYRLSIRVCSNHATVLWPSRYPCFPQGSLSSLTVLCKALVFFGKDQSHQYA